MLQAGRKAGRREGSTYGNEVRGLTCHIEIDSGGTGVGVGIGVAALPSRHSIQLPNYVNVVITFH